MGTRKAAALAAVGVAALAVRRYAALRKAMAAVAPELRTPALGASSIPFNKLTLPIVRMAMGFSSSPGPGVSVTKHHVGDSAVDVLVLTPSERRAPRPALLYLHGGGMMAGTAQFEVAARGTPRKGHRCSGGVAGLPAGTRKPLPRRLDDCMATLQWMVEHADELGIDPDRIAVCGASAGGGLAAAVAQRAFDEGIPLRAQALVYPMIDDRTALRDDLAGRGELTWSPKSNRFGWTAYLGREPRLSDAPEYAAPARRTDLAGLPPAWIGVGDLDVFYDEDVAYAEKLKAAGVPCELVTVPGMYHGADGIVQKASSMRDFRASMVEHLRTYLDAAA